MLNIETLKMLSLNIGFDAIGVAKIEPLLKNEKFLNMRISEEKCNVLSFLSRNGEKRANPALLVEGAESIIVTLTNYYTKWQGVSDAPILSKSSYGTDYHYVIKRRLYSLITKIQEYESDFKGSPFIDSAPIFEKEWARRAGLGWIGKNTLLINRDLGSYTFIGVIISNLKLDLYSTPYIDEKCGSCTKCIDNCPTGAICSYHLNCKRCIAYQTIENREAIPEEIRSISGNRIFGCDICQDCCPWNSSPRESTIHEFYIDDIRAKLTNCDWLNMDKKRFNEIFKKSALYRTGLEKLKSNII